jgi:hypothetical protein
LPPAFEGMAKQTLAGTYPRTFLIQQVLTTKAWKKRMKAEDLRGLTPLFYGHINPYAAFHLDLNTRLEI